MFEFDGILLKPCLLQPCFHVAGTYHQDFRQGLGCLETFLFIGSGVRLSKGWVQKDENLRTRIGCTQVLSLNI